MSFAISPDEFCHIKKVRYGVNFHYEPNNILLIKYVFTYFYILRNWEAYVGYIRRIGVNN